LNDYGRAEPTKVGGDLPGASFASGSGRPAVANRLRDMRGPGESYSDIILRLVEMEAKKIFQKRRGEVSRSINNLIS